MDRERQLFNKLLESNGLFATQPRIDMFNVLQKHNAIDIQSLIDKLPRQNQSTVYRNIRLFERLGVINRLQLGWHSKLELSDVFHHHHHHMTCLKCDKVIVLPEDLVIEDEIARLSYTHKFKAIDHQLEIRGLCKTCQ